MHAVYILKVLFSKKCILHIITCRWLEKNQKKRLSCPWDGGKTNLCAIHTSLMWNQLGCHALFCFTVHVALMSISIEIKLFEIYRWFFFSLTFFWQAGWWGKQYLPPPLSSFLGETLKTIQNFTRKKVNFREVQQIYTTLPLWLLYFDHFQQKL